MADKESATGQRRGRLLLIVLLGVGLLAAVGTLSAAWVGRDEPATTVASPSVQATTAAPMTSEEAVAEYYRQHPKSTGWWQWLLIGGLLAALAVVGILLLTRPKQVSPPGN